MIDDDAPKPLPDPESEAVQAELRALAVEYADIVRSIETKEKRPKPMPMPPAPGVH